MRDGSYAVLDVQVNRDLPRNVVDGQDRHDLQGCAREAKRRSATCTLSAPEREDVGYNVMVLADNEGDYKALTKWSETIQPVKKESRK